MKNVDLGSRKKGTYILQGNAKAHTSLQPKLLDTFVDGILECIRYVRPLDYTWVHRWKSTISRPNSVRYNNHSDWYSINTRENFLKIDVYLSSKMITYLNTYSKKGGLPLLLRWYLKKLSWAKTFVIFWQIKRHGVRNYCVFSYKNTIWRQFSHHFAFNEWVTFIKTCTLMWKW